MQGRREWLFPGESNWAIPKRFHYHAQDMQVYGFLLPLVYSLKCAPVSISESTITKFFYEDKLRSHSSAFEHTFKALAGAGLSST